MSTYKMRPSILSHIFQLLEKTLIGINTRIYLEIHAVHPQAYKLHQLAEAHQQSTM